MSSGDGGPIRVLHVDDDADLADLAAIHLERAGEEFSVLTVTDPFEALSRLDAEPVDCVVADYVMPGLDGLELLKEIRADYPDLPFILFTSRGSEEIASEAISAGITDYIHKERGTDQYAVLANRIENAVTRYRAEQALETERDRLDVLFTHSPDPIVRLAIDGTEPVVRAVNAAFESVFGHDEDAAVDASINDLVVPEDGTPDREPFERFGRGERVTTEVRRRAADGVRDFRLQLLPVPDPAGPSEGYAIYTDVTERRTRERRLSALHEATRELMEGTSREAVLQSALGAAASVLGLHIAGFYEVDDDGTALVPVAATEQAREEFGSLPRIDHGSGVAWTVYETGEAIVSDDIRTRDDLLNPETPIRSELIVPVGDDAVFMAGSTEVGAFDDLEASLARVLAANVEAALERADRERELARQNERLDEFASVVSHDLRGPLNLALGRIELARDEVDQPDLEVAVSALERMDALIDDVLALARGGESVVDPEAVLLGEVAQSAWAMLETDTAELLVHDDVDRVVADDDRLRRLFENLFRNAVEHGGEDVTVCVGSIESGFFVADDGAGIPAEDRESVLRSGYSTTDDGSGYGLAIVSGIAEAHDWELSVGESDAGGARFDLTGVTTT